MATHRRSSVSRSGPRWCVCTCERGSRLRGGLPGNTAAMDRISEYIPVAPRFIQFLSDSRSFQYVSFESRGSSTWLLGDVYVCPGVSLISEIRVSTGVPPYEEDYWTLSP